MTREENLHWIDQEIKTWENECQSKHPIKEALYAARRALEQEPCEDAVSRKSVIAIIQNHWWNCRDIDKLVNGLPPVTPQESNTWSLDDARKDFMYDVYNTLDFLPTNEEANRIIDSFDRVTSSIEQALILEKDGTLIVTTEHCGNVGRVLVQYGTNGTLFYQDQDPQPKTGYISIDDVMSVFDDFMCGEVDEEGAETFLEMLKDKAESEE